MLSAFPRVGGLQICVCRSRVMEGVLSLPSHIASIVPNIFAQGDHLNSTSPRWSAATGRHSSRRQCIAEPIELNTNLNFSRTNLIDH